MTNVNRKLIGGQPANATYETTKRVIAVATNTVSSDVS
jgi:hypothetical protein